jgi:parallel beta-helix repeat protein
MVIVINISPNTEAATVYVGSGPGNSTASIQDAIDNYANDGDTVFVYSGTYNENIVIGKTISLIGEGRDVTTIELMPATGTIIEISADWVNVSGFSLLYSGNWWNDAGIYLDGVENCSITDNNISYNPEAGVYFSQSKSITLSNNIFLEDSIIMIGSQVEHWNTHTIDSTNTVNGKPIYYLKDQVGGTVPLGAGQVILANCSGVTVEDQVLNNGTIGILMGHSSNNTIQRNDVYYQYVYGFFVRYCNDNEFIDNNATRNSDYGIYIRYSDNNNFTGNNASENGLMGGFGPGGIYIRNSDGNNLTNNIANQNINGIYIRSSSGCTVNGNEANTNGQNGIYLWSSGGATVNGNTASGNFDGIYIRSSSGSEIDGNTVLDNVDDGIQIRQTTGSTISNNTALFTGDDGFYFLSSNGNTIFNNTASQNVGDGIFLSESSGNTLSSNTVLENYRGISLDSSNSNTIVNNNASDNECGIYLTFSSYANLTQNTMFNDGIFIDDGFLAHWNTHSIDTTNTVNGKPVYYWKNQTFGAVPSDGGQVILANCTSVDISSATTTFGTVGIELGFSWTNTLIANVASSNNWYGIYLYSSDDNLIWANTASFNGLSGIHIGYSNINIINSNTMQSDGIWIEGDLIGHWNTHTFDNGNTVNGKPVYYFKDQTGGAVPSDGGEVILANCSNMEITNSELTLQTVGIELGFSMNITINGNNLSGNRFGVHLYNSDQNTILNNTVSYNTEYGIQLVMTDSNLVYHNNIIENTNQAFDDRATNRWNETYSVSGNYWSDYTGPDLFYGPLQNILGSDGIGDISNPIDGNSFDFYPLINPWDYTSSIPTAPQNLLATAGNTYVNLTWDPPASNGSFPIYAYRIYRNTTSGAEVFYVESGSELFFNDTGVTAGITYFYEITAVTVIGEGPFSNEDSGMPFSEPSEPLGLLETSGASFVNLTWSPPLTDGGFPITNYTIYRGEIPGIPTYIIEIGNLTNFNDTTAINGVTYYYNITAKNSIGEGPKSLEISATPVSVPDAPFGLIAQEGNASVNITWNPPLDDGGSVITGYNIYRDDVPWVYQFVPAGQLYFNDTSLSNGVMYTYNITAINAIGEGLPSLDISATPKTIPYGPQNLQGLVGDTLINLTWMAPSNNGGSPVTGYRIYKGNQSGNLTLLVEVGDILFYEDTNVINGNTYYYVVRAINIVGEGSPSLEIPATPGTVPGFPTSLLANAGDSFVELTWSAPSSDGGSSIIEYVIYRSTTSGSGFTFIETSNDLNYNDTTVSNGIKYYYIVAAKNAIGEGPSSIEANDTPLGVPSTPENTAAISGESYVYISWDAPSSDGGSSITKYLIYRGTTSGDLTYLDEVSGVIYFNDTTGSDGTEYFYKITAVNVIGESAQSTEVSGIPFAYPGISRNVNAVSGNTYIYVTWDQPAFEGSSAITNYLIYRGTASGGETLLDELGNILFFNDTGVTRGVKYYYYIVAKNSEGTGPDSLEVNGTAISAPEKPENVVDDAGNSYVHLSWDVPEGDGGSEITNYRIYRRTGSGVDTLIAEIGNLLQYNDTTVTNGITYYYKIAAVNAIGESVGSDEIFSMPWVDTDKDGLLDHVDDDDDNDGLLDSEELEIGTDPLNPDSDGDTYNDKEDLFPMDSSKWKEEEPESSNLIWILLILILVIVVVLVLFLATRKKGKPKEETVPEGEKKELPPPPGSIKEEGSEGEQEDSTFGDEEPKEGEKLDTEEPEFEAESNEEVQDEISSEEPKIDDSIEQESQEVISPSEKSTLDEPKEEILNEPELDEEDLPTPED